MIRRSLSIIITISVLIETAEAEQYMPILFWHSAGESCCGDEFKLYSDFLYEQLSNDVYIKSVSVANDSDDKIKSLTLHPFDQIEHVCDIIKSDEKFRNGYNGIGLSQGALLLRGLAQTCPFPPMKNLISLAGPQNGVHSFPRCSQRFGPLCGIIQSSINTVAYTWPLQKFVTPLTYWHDTNENRYRRGSSFLAVLNNEKEFNASYVINLQKLNRIVLVKYKNDGAIVPNESSWFGFYDENGNQYTMEATEIYKGDKLGLRGLKDAGKLVLLESPRDHIEIEPIWFVQNIIPHLKEV